jgi:sugar phosphate isomerase/epimerase
MAWQLSAFADEASENVDEQIKALQRDGLSLVDLRNVDGINISELPVDHAKQVRAKLDAAGIAVGMFGSPIGKIDLADDFDIDLKKLDHLGVLADVFDCRAVRMFSYFNKAELPMDQWQTQAVDRLGRLRDRAAKLNLTLYHENERHIFGDRLEQVLVLRDQLRDEHFRLIFDFDNFNQSGDNVWENWQQLKNATDAFHLKDSTKNNEHVPIGQGDTQAKEILADALSRGWFGPVSLEPHLQHSAAVQATGASGSGNKAFTDMPTQEVFHIAAETANNLLRDIGAYA